MNRSEVKAAPRATSLHFRGTSGRTLKIKAKMSVTTTYETTQLAVRISTCGGAAGPRYLSTAATHAVTINDASRNRPAPTTSAKSVIRSLIRFKMLRNVLAVVSTGTLQMVFIASLSSLVPVVALKNNVISPTKLVIRPLEGRCASIIV